MAVDVTVGVPANRDGGAAVIDMHQTTKALEKTKKNHHGRNCGLLGYDFLPAAFTSCGWWGEILVESSTESSKIR